MRGQIKSRSKGSYTITLNLPRVLREERRREVFTVRGTRKEAEAAMHRRISEIESGLVVTGTRVTLAQFIDRWLAFKENSDIARSTLERYQDICRRYIVPDLGSILITKLSPLQIEEVIASWRFRSRGGNREGQISTRTVHHIYSTLRTILYHAQRWNVISRNPCANVEPISRGHASIKALEENQVLNLVALLSGDPLQTPTLTAAMTGLRRGELLGLRWADIDFKQQLLHVRQALEVAGGALRFKEPKTPKSRRTIPLPKQAIQALRGTA